MARMPGVQFLGIADNGVMSTKDIVCVHTIVGYQAGGNAAHFTTGAAGKIVQARDTNFRSAANLNGNHRVIAIENEDTGPAYKWVGGAPPPFTAVQAEAIAKILLWCHKTHNIPLTLIPDSKPGRRGIAYHRQGIDGNFTGPYKGRVAGGEVWSSSFGKVCPGDNRITQLIEDIIPRARALAGGATEDDMTPDDLMKHHVKDGTYDQEFEHAFARMSQATERLFTMAPQLAAIQGALSASEARIVAAVQADVDGEVNVAELANALANQLDQSLVAALANELDRRARDGDPGTGPVT